MIVTTLPSENQLQEDDRVLFLDYDGVLHPDAVFRMRHGLELRAPGHLLMHADLLAEILQDFPQIKIVLSTSWVRLLSFRRARGVLPASLQQRTVGATWHSRMPRAPLYGYDLYTRYEQIRAAVTAAGLTRWIAIDDDPDYSWPANDSRLIRCDPDFGLGAMSTQNELREKLAKITDGV
ncbi:MAG: HAD domain-containing protein [Pseudomonas sp.]